MCIASRLGGGGATRQRTPLCSSLDAANPAPTPLQAATGLFLALSAACLALAALMEWAPGFGDYAPALAVTIAGALYLGATLATEAAEVARFLIAPWLWAPLLARYGGALEGRGGRGMGGGR